MIMDGLGCHHDDMLLTECDARNIYVIFLAPHSSDQCQPLDLVTFALLKRYFSQFIFSYLRTEQSHKMIQIMGAWYQATAPHQVISEWFLMGVIPFRGQDGQKYVRIDRTKARSVRGCTEGLPQMPPFGLGGSKRIRLPRA
jgi:hypothetical protein